MSADRKFTPTQRDEINSVQKVFAEMNAYAHDFLKDNDGLDLAKRAQIKACIAVGLTQAYVQKTKY